MADCPKIEKEFSWLSNEDRLRHVISVSLFVALILITVFVSTGHAQREEQASVFIETQYQTWRAEHADIHPTHGDSWHIWCIPTKRRGIQQSWHNFVARIEVTEEAHTDTRRWTWHKNQETQHQANLNGLCNIEEHAKLLGQSPRPIHRGSGFPLTPSPELYRDDRDNTPSQAEYDEYDKRVTDYNKLNYLYLEWFQPYTKGRDAATSGREMGAAYIAYIKQWCIHSEVIWA